MEGRYGKKLNDDWRKTESVSLKFPMDSEDMSSL